MLFHVTPATGSSARRRGLFLRAMAFASLAIAGFALPFVWDLLELVNQMPKMTWLHDALAQQPIASWLMMFVWGACIPGALLLGMHRPPHHKFMMAGVMLLLMWVAVTWYVHMPSIGLCNARYPQSEWSCSALQWAGSMSLGIATAAYVFLMLGLAVSAMGCLAEGLDEDTAHAR